MMTPAASGGFLIFNLILAALIWGSSFTATKFVLATFDPFLVAFSRLVIALLGEALNWLQSVAMLLVSGSVIYSQRPESNQATALAFERSP